MKTRFSRRLRPIGRSRGYTVIEVLSAMTLFAIGAAGVIGMQRVTIKGGTDARRFDVASNVASQWAHRLQRDSMTWTLPNVNNPTVSNLDATTWLRDILSRPNEWISPPASGSPGLSPSFDMFGRDVPDGHADTMFCVQHRLSWLADPVGGTVAGGLIHAEVRVVWSRLDKAPIARCSALEVDLELTDPTRTNYHVVQVSTALRQNPNE